MRTVSKFHAYPLEADGSFCSAHGRTQNGPMTHSELAQLVLTHTCRRAGLVQSGHYLDVHRLWQCKLISKPPILTVCWKSLIAGIPPLPTTDSEYLKMYQQLNHRFHFTLTQKITREREIQIVYWTSQGKPSQSGGNIWPSDLYTDQVSNTPLASDYCSWLLSKLSKSWHQITSLHKISFYFVPLFWSDSPNQKYTFCKLTKQDINWTKVYNEQYRLTMNSRFMNRWSRLLWISYQKLAKILHVTGNTTYLDS